MPRCPKCGLENPPDSMVCARCGAELGKVKAEPQKPEAEPSRPPLAEAPSQGRRWFIIGAAIVMIVVVGLAAVFLVFKPGVGTGPGGTPLYAGAVENKEAMAQYQPQMENVGIEFGAYMSTDSPTTIANWYQTEMTNRGWSKENEINYSTTYGETYYFFYKRGDDGVIIGTAPMNEKTGILILASKWGNTALSSVWYSYTIPPEIGAIPLVSAAAQTDSSQDNIQIEVYSGSIPTGDWEYRLSQTSGTGTWTIGTVALSIGTVNLENKASDPGTWYVSLRHKTSGYNYFSDEVVTVE